MGDTNSKRISHEIENLPTSFRKDNLQQIINDLSEDIDGKGFVEAIYLAVPNQVFIDKIIVWDAPAKNKKRKESTFSRSGPVAFITGIVTDTFSEDGTSVISTATTTITLSGTKQFLSSDTVITRP